MRASPVFLGLVALILAACGGEDQHSARETEQHASTLHIRAAGMVKSLGIT